MPDEMHDPGERRRAKVISDFKKDDRIVSSNYQGISLINTTYKFYGKICNERHRSTSDILGLLLDEHSGFRKDRSLKVSLKISIEK